MNTVDTAIFITTILTALGSGLIAGVFFAFSTSVMKALGRLPSNEGMAAMQWINIVIINPLFLGVFLGTAVICAGLAILSFFRWERGAAFLFAGAVLYLIGSVAVTMLLNMPLNNALAAATPTDPQSGDLWKNYLANWTFWNHVRAAASLGAAAAFTIGLVYIK
jgi:uncharacterized membrane protein